MMTTEELLNEQIFAEKRQRENKHDFKSETMEQGEG
jgi:hypothetical protein